MKMFKVIANEKTFAYENAKKVIPDFWKEHYQTGKGKVVRGVYGKSNCCNWTNKCW